MSMQIWDKEFQQFLMETFQYDPVSGFIKRRVWDKHLRDPEKSIGHISANEEYLYSIVYKGKTILLRLIKLAYFLNTGKQYHKILTKDGNKTNLVFDNLIPAGPELVTEEQYIKEKTDIIIKSIETHAERKRIATELAVEKMERLKQEKKAAREALKLNKESSPETILRKARAEEKLKKLKDKQQQEQWMKEYGNRNFAQEIIDLENTPELVFKREKRNEIINRIWLNNLKDTYKSGLFTNGNRDEASEYFKICNFILGEDETYESLFNKWEAIPVEFEKLEKWEQDRVFVAAVLRPNSYFNTETDKRMAFTNYKYKGQVVEGKFGQLNSHWQAEQERRLAELESELPELWEIEKAARAKHESSLEEHQSNLESGESMREQLSDSSNPAQE